MHDRNKFKNENNRPSAGMDLLYDYNTMSKYIENSLQYSSEDLG